MGDLCYFKITATSESGVNQPRRKRISELAISSTESGMHIGIGVSRQPAIGHWSGQGVRASDSQSDGNNRRLGRWARDGYWRTASSGLEILLGRDLVQEAVQEPARHQWNVSITSGAVVKSSKPVACLLWITNFVRTQ